MRPDSDCTKAKCRAPGHSPTVGVHLGNSPGVPPGGNDREVASLGRPLHSPGTPSLVRLQTPIRGIADPLVGNIAYKARTVVVKSLYPKPVLA